MLLKNKVAVITGSNRGIGKQTLEIFSKNGADVIACVRKSSNDFIEYTKTLTRDKNSIDIVDLDLQSENSVKDAIKRIVSMNKKIDILINNAGSIYTGIFQMTTISKLREIFEINFFTKCFRSRSCKDYD